jgi:hypothetical protein
MYDEDDETDDEDDEMENEVDEIDDKDTLNIPSGIISPRDAERPAHGSPAIMNANGGAPEKGSNIANANLEDEMNSPQDFLKFANWAFSAQGLPDLQVLAWGTFSYDGRYARLNVLLCKGENGHRTLTKVDVTCWDLVHDNIEMLSACAVDQLWTSNDQSIPI